MREHFRRVLLHWADPHGDGSGRDGADGFRIDHMMDDLDNKHLATRLFETFWSPIFASLRERRPGFRIMAEQSDWGFGADWLTRGDADMVFAFPLRSAIDKLDKAGIVKALRDTERLTPAGKHQIVFVENHDTDRLMSLLDGDMAKARAAAAIMLFGFGTGPIKGFAVTLSIGILTSMFTAVTGSRALVNLLYGGRKLQTLNV